MGCCFSKKSKRKSPEKEDLTPTAATVETTSNAVPLGNSTDEAPKQYSWDKREKVTRWTPGAEQPESMTHKVLQLSQTYS